MGRIGTQVIAQPRKASSGRKRMAVRWLGDGFVVFWAGEA